MGIGLELLDLSSVLIGNWDLILRVFGFCDLCLQSLSLLLLFAYLLSGRSTFLRN